ncbi:RluA family pseudouridine synthase [Francisella philomiragia]|uniref:Pseudouridine synthase n=1 Tax=Francisella philomiragia subsp. philomiragia (strain ATCC 25017 / CCUG 19701 / FSC 153 / O\|nr:RluA family pseudouridine synthase [Francisella philomiragia]AJI47336.1 pseudouridine synthase, RluA family protein [Francisella philomiragia]AJI49054.1 pseudouridine synthase, RluA family protein [Francisella philomiragia]MBK2019968.1 RluA family pseudouridine synthase [Francisella philomiragia]MBK2029709.1 RluA family pseudouridine synthase [Francisella philomiragia]MBK2264616.1 RluA family pseudouridine synthase [Francisella philomiragia]
MANNTLSNKFHQKIMMHPDHAGKRIDSTINELFEQFSRSQIQKWIKDGLITVNGKTTKSKHILLGDEEVEINIELLPTNEWLAEDIDLNIVFEDNDIIVIDKPIDMVVHPGAGNMTGTISNALLHKYPNQDKLPRAGIVHRLDKDTSGLMVAAKSSIAYHNLVQQLSERKVSRKYLAIVEGEIYEEGTINQPIGRDLNNRTKMTINHKGKEAITHYKPIEVYDGFTLIECQLETGRTHQIRVHMKSIKHPLVGDQTYNKSSTKLDKVGIENINRQALHAYKLSFMHPTSQKIVRFKSKLPEDMLNLKLELQQTIEFYDDYEEDYYNYE